MIKVKHRLNKNEKKSQVLVFDKEKLVANVKRDAKTLGIAESTAEAFVEKAVERVAKWAEKRAAITSDDLNRQLATELKKYNSDLAYVYQNRGKII